MKRGIIASSGKAERIDDEGVHVTSHLTKEDLNYYTLYFDEIVIPTNNLIHVTLPKEEELISLDIIKRPTIHFSSWSSNIEGYYDLFIDSQLKVAKKLVQLKDDIDWTIHQIGDETTIIEGFNKDFNTIKFNLQDCLPVPLENISYEKILEFKNERKDELKFLHESIDKIYLEILNSPDPDFASKKCISDLKEALLNLEKVSIESFAQVKKYEITTELNLNMKDVALAMGGVAIFDFYSLGLTIPITSILAGIGSVINIKASKTKSFEPAENNLKLSYLANAKKLNIL
jgi:hypothetical protein